jgi:hypothetical protein
MYSDVIQVIPMSFWPCVLKANDFCSITTNYMHLMLMTLPPQSQWLCSPFHCIKAQRSWSVPYATSIPMFLSLWYTPFWWDYSLSIALLITFLLQGIDSYIWFSLPILTSHYHISYLFSCSHPLSHHTCLTHYSTPTLSIKLVPPMTTNNKKFTPIHICLV